CHSWAPPDTCTPSLHDALPIFEQAQAERQAVQRQVLELGQGLALHALLDGLAVLVEVVELLGHVAYQRLVVAQQALDAQAHVVRSEEHTSELQSRENLVCRLLL